MLRGHSLVGEVTALPVLWLSLAPGSSFSPGFSYWKRTVSGAGRLKVLVLHLLDMTDAEYAVLQILLFLWLAVGCRGSHHFSTFLRQALAMESVRESHRAPLSQETMGGLGCGEGDWWVVYQWHNESGIFHERGSVTVQLSTDLVFSSSLIMISRLYAKQCKIPQQVLSCSYSTGFLLHYRVSVVRRYLWST